MTMKLTAVLYSVLIFISCANNTAKDKQREITVQSSSEPETVVNKNTAPNIAVVSTEVMGKSHKEVPSPTPTEEIKEHNKGTDGAEIVPAYSVVDESKTTVVEEKEASEKKQETNDEMEDRQKEKQESVTDENIAKEEIFKVPSHKAWDTLLQKYVDKAGNVDYNAFRNSIAELSAYLDVLAKTVPQSDWSKNEKLAYYINLYNAATVKLILDNYPTKSIKDIKKPWGKDIVKVGGDLVSLGYIEHKVLRKMNEPRIHFAINCASYSCPKLVNRAFTAAAMEQQLEAATKDFVNDTTRNQFTPEEANLSEIFKWYKGDFTDNGSLKDYINNYLATPMTANTKIKYLKYNWNLNEK